MVIMDCINTQYKQMTLADIPEKKESRCMDCYYEYREHCASWKSKYEDMTVPQNGCDYFDGVSGGIPMDALKG